MKRHNKKAHPLLAGEIHDDTTIRVWCPFCKRYHFHYWDITSKSDDVTHRVAHCHNENSPFDKGGYFIGLLPKP